MSFGCLVAIFQLRINFTCSKSERSVFVRLRSNIFIVVCFSCKTDILKYALKAFPINNLQLNGSFHLVSHLFWNVIGNKYSFSLKSESFYRKKSCYRQRCFRTKLLWLRSQLQIQFLLNIKTDLISLVFSRTFSSGENEFF